MNSFNIPSKIPILHKLFVLLFIFIVPSYSADFIFIVNGTGSVSVLDAGTLMPVAGSPFATTPMPAVPPNEQIAITISPDKTRLYIPSFQADTATTVAVMDINSSTGALSHIAGSPFMGFSAPFQAAISPDGNFVYITNSGTDEILVFDKDMNPLGMPVSTGAMTSPHGISLSPDGLVAYVACTGTSQIESFTVSAAPPYLTLANTVPSGTGGMTPGMNPYVVEADPSGTYVYTTNLNGVVTRFNPDLTGASSVAASMSFLIGIAFDPGGSRVYVADPTNGQVLVLDPVTLAPVIPPISSQGSNPFVVAVNNDRVQLFTTNVGTDDLSVRDIVHDTYPALAGSPFGGLSRPYGIAFSSASVPPAAPTNPSGQQRQNTSGLLFELFNTLAWSYGDSSQIAGFFIYRNGVKIATVSPSTRTYEEHNRKKGVIDTYEVTAFNQNGDESNPISIQVK